MIHNTHFSQFIPCTAIHYVTGTWTNAAGQVVGTICKHKSANAETAVVSVPIAIPSNSIALQGSYLITIELDYEILIEAMTSVTAAVKKISRGVDTAVAVVSTPTSSQSLTAGTTAATVDQHKLTVTLTTPAWIDNDEEYLCQVSFEAGANGTIDVLGAMVNFTKRM
jgi:hypothetical protein